MAIPPGAQAWSEGIDPHEELDFMLLLDGDEGMLEDDEGVASITIDLLPQATLLGLQKGTGARAMSQPTPSSVLLWFTIHEDFRSDPAFDDAGTQLAMEMTVVTDSDPARTHQATLLLPVAQA